MEGAESITYNLAKKGRLNPQTILGKRWSCVFFTFTFFWTMARITLTSK